MRRSSRHRANLTDNLQSVDLPQVQRATRNVLHRSSRTFTAAIACGNHVVSAQLRMLDLVAESVGFTIPIGDTFSTQYELAALFSKEIAVPYGDPERKRLGN